MRPGGKLRLLFGLVLAAPVAPAAPHLYLAGDSTMADYPVDPPNPQRGWGQSLPGFFRDPATVVNLAANGRSTKSFLDEGLWRKLVDALQPGDWVIVQFGHNDEKEYDPRRYTAPRGEYRENLRRFVADVRAKEAHPVLATPVARRKWSEAGELVETHGDYPEALRVVAVGENVPLLELNRLTAALETGHGPEGSKRLHLHIPAGVYRRKPEGYSDDTHYSVYGAERVAALAVQEILRLRLPLAALLAATPPAGPESAVTVEQ